MQERERGREQRGEMGRQLRRLEAWLELPMIFLALVWLALLVVEFIWGLTPLLGTLVLVIWGIFIFDFVVKLLIAPNKAGYLKSNWLTGIALLIPALRVFRVVQAVRLLRAARVARGARLMRVVSSVNRGRGVLRTVLGRHRLGYVTAFSAVVLLAGAAGVFAFENSLPDGRPFGNYWDALWWTAMILTTMGSEQWPQSTEGRVLTVLLSLYGLAILGYVTATLASIFIVPLGKEGPPQASRFTQSIDSLREEVQQLRAEMRRLTRE